MTIDEIFALIMTQFPSFLGFIYALWLQMQRIKQLDEMLRLERIANSALVERLLSESAGNSKLEEIVGI